VFHQLSTPSKIQDFLDTLEINYEIGGETNFSPSRVMEERKAHCLEGAVFAAAVLAYHGHKPFLMDFQTAFDDEDHVVAVFTWYGHWGAISKTNHSVLRYRDPIYRTPRELAMSYAHEYFMWDGRKSLRAYSTPFDMSQYPPEKWVTSRRDLDWLPEAIDSSLHFPVLPKRKMQLRIASKIEIAALRTIEWPRKTKDN
jgi:hypothetical protein